MVTRRPYVFGAGAVAAQPQLTLNAPQVEPLGELVLRAEHGRHHRDRSAWRLVLGQRLPPEPLRLVKVLQAQVRRQLHRAQAQANLLRSGEDLGRGGALVKAQIGHRQLHGGQGAGNSLGGEQLAGEQRLGRFVKPHAVLQQPGV